MQTVITLLRNAYGKTMDCDRDMRATLQYCLASAFEVMVPLQLNPGGDKDFEAQFKTPFHNLSWSVLIERAVSVPDDSPEWMGRKILYGEFFQHAISKAKSPFSPQSDPAKEQLVRIIESLQEAIT